MAIPKAFVSYSHDSEEHKKWVFSLAQRLMSKGVDVSLDLWDLQPGGDLPEFMEKHLAQADKVLMVCTDKYVKKANAGEGGVGYEKMIVTADLMRKISSTKVIPLIRQAPGSAETPTFLSTKRYLNFSDSQFEFSFDELVRTLHAAPLFVKPEVGGRPDFDTSPPVAEETGDPILLVMESVIHLFEKNVNSHSMSYSDLVREVQKEGMSRLYFDMVLARVLALSYLAESPRVAHLYTLTDQGRAYAIDHGLG